MPVVNNQAALDAAIKNAKSGDVILLAPGTYSSITMTAINPASNITIQSLDTNNKATVGTVWLTSSSNITLKDFNVVRPTRPTDEFATANRVLSSSNITIDGVHFSGGTGDPSDALGNGLAIRGGTNNKLINSTIDHFVIGLDVRGVDTMLVRGNNFLDNRRDHSNYSEMTNVVIDDNRYEGLYPINGEHPDAIQFMTMGRAYGSSNISITNNVVLQGDGRGTQGFYMQDEVGTMPFKNVTIDNNLIYLSGMYHGINLENTQGAKITNNTITSVSDEKSTWIRVENVTGTVSNNLTDQIIMEGTNNLTTNQNIELVKNPEIMRQITDLNKGSKATIAGLTYNNAAFSVGYHTGKNLVGAASQFTKEVAAQLAAPKPAVVPRLLLDLSFSAKGVVDSSEWSADETVNPLGTGAINNGMLSVKTGSGMELSRGTSRQLYGLSAFTLNFDMKRDGQTAPAGQILGIYKSWNIALRADGELTFTMTNDAGVTSTMTTSGAKITDTSVHKIALSYQSGGISTLYVDGKAVGSAKMSGSTRQQEYWGLYVGSPFTAAFSGGVGDVEMRETAFSQAQILALNAGSTVSKPATAADTLKVMVAKGVADTAATLAGSTAWGGAMASPATLSLTSAFGTTGSSPSPLATALATASANGSLYQATSAFSMLTTPRLASLDLYHG
ncbi:Concanavalin A-like lectin/glucanases superfamily protein [Sphingomonas sp. NFR04]|uniref:LamG-like jellyroll fold domain-containing protein n=1 Tax=Sphingomonas sp. NFR04 TaxID=1566283 RepID=UPI0008E62108|nr:LamG-like jellyroll fold domain-containing protein [Sphingomonas sp. NFR04]SFJ22547.1 Concanavalin A-like lectin/glucanases superfamily protein [Sphingomonas sp. NFR04]